MLSKSIQIVLPAPLGCSSRRANPTLRGALSEYASGIKPHRPVVVRDIHYNHKTLKRPGGHFNAQKVILVFENLEECAFDSVEVLVSVLSNLLEVIIEMNLCKLRLLHLDSSLKPPYVIESSLCKEF